MKAFNSISNTLMVNPKLSATPTMFICSNDAGAKTTRGRDPHAVRVGDPRPAAASKGAARSRRCAMLWCIPDFQRTTGRTRSEML